MKITTNGKTLTLNFRMPVNSPSSDIIPVVNRAYNKAMAIIGKSNARVQVTEEGLLGLALESCFIKRTRRINNVVVEE